MLATIDCACELAATIDSIACASGEPCVVVVGRCCYEVTAPAYIIRAACRIHGIVWGAA